jgi:hypothetical protein
MLIAAHIRNCLGVNFQGLKPLFQLDPGKRFFFPENIPDNLHQRPFSGPIDSRWANPFKNKGHLPGADDPLYHELIFPFQP